MTKQNKVSKISTSKKTLPLFLVKRIHEGTFILVLSATLFLILSLLSYEPLDPGVFSKDHHQDLVLNAGGQVGAYLANAFYFLFGYFCFALPLSIAYTAWRVLKELREFDTVNRIGLLLRLSGIIFFMIAGCSLLSFDSVISGNENMQIGGGLLGNFVAGGFDYALNASGSLILLMAIFLVGITCFTGLSWVHVLEWIGFYTLFTLNAIKRNAISSYQWIKNRNEHTQTKTPRQFFVKKTPSLDASIRARKERSAPSLMPEIISSSIKAEPTVIPTLPSQLTSLPISMPAIVTPLPISVPATRSAQSLKEKAQAGTSSDLGCLPSLSLLDKGAPGKPMGGYTHQELETVSREVEQHLLDFGIQADVVAVHPGPVITRFELQLAAGIKVSKLTTLSKDLARSLSVTSVRVVEVIPGKAVVGLELPNQHREMVRLSEVLSSDVYQQGSSALTIALGVDIAGYPMVVDLAKMPHLLVAGTTGSGKSVGINAMILSILFKASPEQVRLIMIDPKMLELSVYDGIPHLLTPVVTDMKEAASALRWCVAEMEKRYKLMSAIGVRNLAGYNLAVQEAEAKGEPLLDPLWKATNTSEIQAPFLEHLPYVVVIIDELADMMMVVGKKVEQLIARIAQKARAAGIHLILATQRPSVDVLTGLIKSNIPTRMSFQVSSKIDSRTILDQQGAEQLLGHGDMLYLAPGTGAPLRVHGAFVDDKEVHRVADDWRLRGKPEYIEDIIQCSDAQDGSDEGERVEDRDPLYDEAVEFIMQTRKASISSVQRRLKIGYNRAARMIEEMERTGLVGPLDGGYRDVLVPATLEEN